MSTERETTAEKIQTKKSGLSRLQYFMIIFIKHLMDKSMTLSSDAGESKASTWPSQEIKKSNKNMIHPLFKPARPC